MAGLADTAVFLGEADGGLEIARIIERIEDADHVDAVFNGFAAELFHHVVGIVFVAENVLAAEQHLQLGVGQCLTQRAEAVPRVLIEEAEAGVKRRAPHTSRDQ